MRRKCPSFAAFQIYPPWFITSILYLLPKVLIKVWTGSLLAINQVSATNPNTLSLHSAPSQPYQSKDCWPGYHPSQSAEWWAWEMGCCSNPRREKSKSRHSMPLTPQQECSTRWEAQCWECCNLSSHRFSWLELARTPSYSRIHCPPRLATNTVRQGLRVCPPENTSSPSEPMIFSNL